MGNYFNELINIEYLVLQITKGSRSCDESSQVHLKCIRIFFKGDLLKIVLHKYFQAIPC